VLKVRDLLQALRERAVVAEADLRRALDFIAQDSAS